MSASRSAFPWRDFSVSSVVAGLVSVFTGYASAAVIVFQAAAAAGATPSQVSSWMWALGIGMGVSTLLLSWRFRMPIVTAWSTPGAALLATSLPGVSLNEAVGAFLFSALLMTLCGVTGLFQRVMHRIPLSLASALLAGVLLRFGLDLFTSLEQELLLVSAMLITFVLCKSRLPRSAIPLTLLVGLVVAALQQQLHFGGVSVALGKPEWVAPAWSWATLVGVGLPLFVVTMASQNLPGVAVLKANGYQPPVSPLLTTTGTTNLLLAPFGAYALNLAAISAAVCMSADADADPRRRYTAALSAGVFYLLMGIFGATVSGLLGAFPPALVAAMAGLALAGTLANGLVMALQDSSHRDAALLTFLMTASGISLWGIGSAFWGLLLGVLVLLCQRRSA
ncbi:benzoate/H(+) symporter BenE family transporter [Isoalcanivorax beigongshangi]|uniref:Benzoate/H(+) symporter BenE family transporter n=1 Tax=Isoalcanivorax beigongshangi TaxID=3238810 RepID=A0ABV4AHU7_9GAMM